MEKEKTNKLVSVIIPCYNDGQYLEETVSSALNSTHLPIEIIIINDGSTDNTQEIGLKLQSQFKNVRYFEHQNKGPSATRNYGVQQSRGEFILPLDADDKISPRYIEIASQILQVDEQVKVVYSEAMFFGNKKGKWNLPEFDLKKLATENLIFNCSMYRKTDFIKSGGYSEDMKYGWEDWEFWISMLKRGGKAYKIPEVCFFYRIKDSDSSLRKSMNKNKKRNSIDFINAKHADFMMEHLNGPLRYSRSWSSTINTVRKLFDFSN